MSVPTTTPAKSGGFRTAAATFLIGASIAVSAPAWAQGLFGPGRFTIEQTDDRFSTSPTTMVIGRNNRVTKKSPVGGIYISGQGLYLDPVVVKSRADGRLVRVGFVVENRTEIDTTYGSVNSLGSLRRVSFLVNGSQLIPATVTAADRQFSDSITYNSISNSASSGLSEGGMIYLKAEDMAVLANASTVAVQVEGTRQTWTIEAKDVSKPFLVNIRAFYLAQVSTGG